MRLVLLYFYFGFNYIPWSKYFNNFNNKIKQDGVKNNNCTKNKWLSDEEFLIIISSNRPI